MHYFVLYAEQKKICHVTIIRNTSKRVAMNFTQLFEIQKALYYIDLINNKRKHLAYRNVII